MEENKTEEIKENTKEKTEKNNKTSFVTKAKSNPWMVSTLVLALVIIVLAIAARGGITGNVISESSASDKLVDYLNGLTGGGVEYVSTEDLGSMYEVTVLYQQQEMPVYVTKDGKYFVPQLVPLFQDASTSSPTTQEPEDIPKTEKPTVELFVMSFCPYGNKAEQTMLPVYNLFKDKVDWKIHYIVSANGDEIRSLHGQPETDQDIREVCALNEYGLNVFWAFATYVNENCGSDGTCWEDAAAQAGADTTKIQNCFDTQGLDLMKQEAQISGEKGANGSPTLIINGVQTSSVYKYGDSEAYKQAICSAFTNAPEECSQVLTSTSTTTTTGGSC